jgi:hypothetical protein
MRTELFLGYYAAISGGFARMFPDNLSVPSSRDINPRSSLKMGQVGCPETSVRNYHYSPPNSP